MEKQTHVSKKKHLLNVILTAVLIFAAMYFCAVTGYRFTRSSKPSQEPVASSTPDMTGAVAVEEEDDPLPDSDLTAASLPQPDIQIPDDPNDYLVIKEGNAVKLYIITSSGEQIYSKDLDIAPESLLAEDRTQLEQGIILESEEALAALMEDYTS